VLRTPPDRRLPAPARPAIDDAVVARHYATGLSTGQIARLLGVDPAGVWRSLRRSGTPIRSHTEAAALRRDVT
jgi:DNA-binding CsgD family transcriptional regulator